MVPGMSSTVTEVDRRRRDQAITACCLAAAALGDPDLAPRRQGRALMSCLGVLASIYPVGQAPTMAQFRSGLSRPLRQLLPNGVDSGESVIWCCSTGWGSSVTRPATCVSSI